MVSIRGLAIMKKLIILTELIFLIILLYLTFTAPEAEAEKIISIGNVSVPYTAHYEMSGTAYTNHEDCVNLENLDGFTAMMTKARVGIVGINIDILEDGTSRVNSVLKMGQIIYVKGQFIEGVFTVEDKGYFRVKYLEGADLKDLTFDIYNLDFFVKDIWYARGFGIQYPIEVWVIGEL